MTSLSCVLDDSNFALLYLKEISQPCGSFINSCKLVIPLFRILIL